MPSQASSSNVESFSSASGLETKSSYDENGRLESVTSPGGAASTLSYGGGSSDFNPESGTDAQSNTQQFAYDPQGNLDTVDTQNPGEQVVDLDYATDPSDPDLDGTLQSSCIGECSGDNERTRYVYDGEGNLIEERPPGSEETPVEQGSTRYEYDGLSRIIAITDGSGNRRTLAYDALDRVTKVTYEGGRYVRYSYDAVGNQTARSEGERNVLGEEQETARDEYDFDERNLLIEERLRSGQENRYAYDASQNLTELEDASGTTRYSYNAVNLVATIIEPSELGGEERDPFMFSYDDDNRRDEATFPNGVTQEFVYDKDRLERIKATSPDGEVLTDLEYSYDEADSARSDGSRNTSLRQRVIDHARGITTRYDYDHLNRLSLAESSGSVSEHYSYAYSGATNLIRTEREDGDPTHYVYNEPHELTCSYRGEKRDSDACADPSTSYDYDQNGNLLAAEGGNSYAYNQRNQTEGITPPGAGEQEIDLGYAGIDQDDRLSRGETEFTQNALGLGYERSDLLGTGLAESATFYTHDGEQGEGERTPILSQRTPEGDLLPVRLARDGDRADERAGRARRALPLRPLRPHGLRHDIRPERDPLRRPVPRRPDRPLQDGRPLLRSRHRPLDPEGPAQPVPGPDAGEPVRVCGGGSGEPGRPERGDLCFRGPHRDIPWIWSR